jgi:hypothetical protein
MKKPIDQHGANFLGSKSSSVMVTEFKKLNHLMRSFKALCVSACLFLVTTALSGATYYIDWQSGSDKNDGRSISSAWKRVPAMNGFSGSYTRSEGDRFIFKGGVTWPVEALPLFISEGGSPDKPVYYGIDKKWHSGAAWTRPVFDPAGVKMSDLQPHRGCPVIVWITAHVEIEGIEVTRFVIDGNAASRFAGIGFWGARDVTVRDCFVHNWVIQTPDDGRVGGISNLYNSSDISAHNCVVKAPEYIDPVYISGGFTSGVGFQGLSLVENSEVIGTTQGLWNCSVVRYTTIRDGGHSFRSGTHENGAWLQNTKEFHNNVLTGWKRGVAIYLLPGWGGRTPHTIRFYNNIIYNNTTGNGVNAACDGSPEENENLILVYNNIMQKIDLGGRAGGKIDIVFQNNLIISDSSSPVTYRWDFIKTLTESNNVIMTRSEAAAVGLLDSNLYRPGSPVPGVTGQGLNLTSVFTIDFDGNLRGNPWDIGPYQLGGTASPVAPPAPPVGLKVVTEN